MNKLTALLAVLTLAGTLVANAADDTAPAKKDAKAKRAEQLKKYDKNGDGKLDDEEKKAMRDDQKKQKENGGGKKEKSN